MNSSIVHAIERSTSLQAELFRLINQKNLRASDVGDLLRLASGKPLLQQPGDPRSKRLPQGTEELFRKIYWVLFAVTSDLSWKRHKRKFDRAGNRRTSYPELMAVTR